jgi:hypothetical protein
MGELEVGGTQREHGQGIGAKRVHHRLDLGTHSGPSRVAPRPGLTVERVQAAGDSMCRSIIVVLIANRLLRRRVQGDRSSRSDAPD